MKGSSKKSWDKPMSQNISLTQGIHNQSWFHSPNTLSLHGPRYGHNTTQQQSMVCSFSLCTKKIILRSEKVFTIDLQVVYWQFSVSEKSIENTAFCPSPGYGLWEFTVNAILCIDRSNSDLSTWIRSSPRGL